MEVTNELNVTLESLSDVIGSTCDADPTVFIYLKHLETFVTVQNNKINFIKHSLTKENFNILRSLVDTHLSVTFGLGLNLIRLHHFRTHIL